MYVKDRSNCSSQAKLKKTSNLENGHCLLLLPFLTTFLSSYMPPSFSFPVFPFYQFRFSSLPHIILSSFPSLSSVALSSLLCQDVEFEGKLFGIVLLIVGCCGKGRSFSCKSLMAWQKGFAKMKGLHEADK